MLPIYILVLNILSGAVLIGWLASKLRRARQEAREANDMAQHADDQMGRMRGRLSETTSQLIAEREANGPFKDFLDLIPSIFE